MKRSIGAMRNRVELFAPSRVSDGALGYKRGDQSKGKLWARVDVVTGREIFRYQHLETEISHKVTIRFRADVVEGCYFLLNGNRKLYVAAVTRPSEGKEEFLEVICREGGQT
jgi:SPP1 family predicted phage head-tail adaptor